MKIFSFLVIIVLTAFHCSAQDSAKNFDLSDFLQAIHASEDSLIDTPFPDFNVKTDAGYFSNKDLKGKVVLLDFWFATCEPCVAAFAALNELNKKMSGNKNFELVAFTFETPEIVERTKKKYGLNFKLISVSRQECKRLMHNFGFPTNAVLDKNGIIKYWRLGDVGETEDIHTFVMKTLLPIIQNQL